MVALVRNSFILLASENLVGMYGDSGNAIGLRISQIRCSCVLSLIIQRRSPGVYVGVVSYDGRCLIDTIVLFLVIFCSAISRVDEQVESIVIEDKVTAVFF